MTVARSVIGCQLGEESRKKGMTGKILVWLLAILLLTTAPLAEAQQPKMPVIGFLPPGGDPSKPGHLVEAFREGLRELGYSDGKNIKIEYRFTLGKLEHIPALVADLIQLKVNVLVVVPQPAVDAAKKSTKTIPIVMISSVDPVAAGHVESLARPGGNVTGLAMLMRELSAKRIELLQEIIPRMTRIGILWDPQGPGPRDAFKQYEAAARAFKLDLQSLEVSTPKPNVEQLFRSAKAARRDALVIVTNPLIGFHHKKIIELASVERLPSMYEDSRFVEPGGLLSYGTNPQTLYRRAATYVDKILKGAKPADLPVEQPTKFEFIINLKTAKQIGLTIPHSVLYRADKVIR
jgi:putative tryptophan/tyrosine transport system substrate-binding protein